MRACDFNNTVRSNTQQNSCDTTHAHAAKPCFMKLRETSEDNMFERRCEKYLASRLTQDTCISFVAKKKNKHLWPT